VSKENPKRSEERHVATLKRMRADLQAEIRVARRNGDSDVSFLLADRAALTWVLELLEEDGG
jgi:hypothetical protein